MKNTAQKSSGYLVLFLFLGIFSSNTFFEHSHVYNSEIIVHSHPFKHGEDGQPFHSHSNNGYMLVILLNNLVNNAIVSLALVSLVLYVTGEIIYSGIKDSCCDTDISTVLLRGPPDPVLS